MIDAYIKLMRLFALGALDAPEPILARSNEPRRGQAGNEHLHRRLFRPGVSLGPREHKLGLRSSQVEEFHFDDVVLPDALPGVEGRGFHMMMSVLEKGCIGIASVERSTTTTATPRDRVVR